MNTRAVELSMSNTTPGPWEIEWYVCREGEKELWRVPQYIGPIGVEHNHWAGYHLDVSEDDARLIAAAPDMFASGKPLADLVEHFSGADSETIAVTAGELRSLAAAIAKAEGRT